MINRKDKLTQIVESANIGTWEWNIITGETTFNEKWAEIVGYTLAELYPTNIDTWIKLTHPEDLAVSNKLLNAHFEGKVDKYHCEVRMRHKNGHWVWVMDSGEVSQFTEKGQPLIMTGIHQEITDRKQVELQLQHKLKLEEIISEISGQLINTSHIDEKITDAFSKLGSFVSASRVYLFMVDMKNETMSNTHEWCAQGVSSEMDELQNLPLSIFPWWMAKLFNKEIIDIADVAEMPPEAQAEKEILESQNIKSVLVLPVYSKTKLIGFVGFDNIVKNTFWSAEDGKVLTILADILSSALISKQRKEELENSYQNFSNYFNLNSDFIFILNSKREIIKANKQVKEILGYSEESIFGKSILLFFPSEVRDKAATMIEESIHKKRSSFALPILSKNKSQIPVETNSTIGNWDGKPAVFIVSKDVSKLKLSEEKFSKIFHNNPEIAGLIRLETGEFVEVNSAFYSKLGFSPKEIIGKEAYTLLKIEKSLRDKILIELNENGALQNIETIIYTKQGAPLNVIFSFSQIKTLDNSYGLFTARDITQNVKTKNELILAKEKAEESDRLKSAFLATMNHELHTPLNHVIGFSELIADITKNETVKEFSNNINQSGLNLLNIIEDIFDLALIEKAEIKVRKQKVFIRDIYLDLKKVIQETLWDFKKTDSIELNFIFDSKLLLEKISTDKPKVMQVMTNIIKNAVKFTRKGQIVLSLELKKNSYLCLSVKDEGIGIPEDKVDIIFDFFRQVDDSHTRKYAGIGIGLAISQKIASAMDGAITVKSKPGVGSCFSYCFPVELIEHKLVVPNQQLGDSNTPDLSGIKILIVEDDVIGLQMTIEMLKPTGCRISTSLNGLEAVKEVTEKGDIDFVLMDLKMPVMDGFEATIEIRKNFTYLPIVALTAYNLNKDKKRAIEAGCNDIITKPIDKQMLFKCLDKLIVK